MPAPYYSPVDPTAEETLLARLASGIVQRLAPTPEDETTDYQEMAEAAEYLVYSYLKTSGGGSLKSWSRSSVSETLAEFGAIEAVVAGAMGSYYVGPVSSPHNTGYVENFI